MKPISELRTIGEKLGRAGMSDMVESFVSSCDGSPKELMKLCGQLAVVAKMSTCDQYWHEQVDKGIYSAELKIESINKTQQG